MRSLAAHIDFKKHTALATDHDIAVGATGFGIEHIAMLATQGFDHRAAGERANLFIAGEQGADLEVATPQSMPGPQQISVHQHAGLHVGHTRPVCCGALDPEGSSCRLASGKHRVAVPQHQHRLVSRLAWVDRAGHASEQVLGVVAVHLDTIGCQKISDPVQHLRDALALVAARIQVDQGFQVGHIVIELGVKPRLKIG